MTTPRDPLEALRLGHWFKLICGASYQDVSKVRNLSLVYSLAGADCIDVAADEAVVHAAWEGITASQAIAPSTALSPIGSRPWLMVSLNDGQDPHFRKAWFDGQQCPVDCPCPCQRVCPAEAILPPPTSQKAKTAGASPNLEVMAERCYGCGRCLPVCPHGLIEERAFTVAAGTILPRIIPQVDAVEIHTQMGRQMEFQHLWRQLAPYISQLQLVAVSCPDSFPGSNTAIVDYLAHLYGLMSPQPRQLLWQTDGRPMSGDIGRGATRATIRLAQKVLNARLPGYVQLAGGTNHYTVAKLRSLNLLKATHRINPGNQVEPPTINGIAYGSYARQLVNLGDSHLEDRPEELWQQVSLARELVHQLKLNTHQAITTAAAHSTTPVPP
ncbi:circadian clock protein LdpA [Leptothoe sp. PORK10 BA2]|uniref:circadian clock protein LdpA n=1 Tax=Leptothoe sp. PORK10 BA2 TaxID=3110254 RepID=UPI002B211517|nr:LdpA C-terminal domain-containing domain [Leptothoe sp. PORK10 BA2]MEA5465046.1 LdpA C-terminal domain-containing domain [Leptothoe sp. PORK10 BA2]